MPKHLLSFAAVLALAACSEDKPPVDAKRQAAIEHACIVARADLPERCQCIAEAVAAKGDETLDAVIVARMTNDKRTLARVFAGMSKLEANHMLTRYEAMGRDVFYHCGKRKVG